MEGNLRSPNKIVEDDDKIINDSKFIDLGDRLVWFDGNTSVHPEIFSFRILNQKSIDNFYTLEINEDIIKYNNVFSPKIKVKNTCDKLNLEFNIPEQYINLNLKEFILKKFENIISQDDLLEDEIIQRYNRIKEELKLYKQYNIENVLKTIIYIIDVFEKNNIVWGTGRGSSCASYILYVVGLHDVDSVKYKLNLKEFFR